MIKFLSKFLLVIFIILPFQNASAIILEPVWKKVPAVFEIKSVSRNKISENSIIGELIKFNDRGINYYLSDDGYTLHHYSVTYSIPVMVDNPNNKEQENIVQHGLYRDLDPALRSKFKKRNSKFTLNIEYNENDPKEFRLIYDGKYYMLNMMFLDI